MGKGWWVSNSTGSNFYHAHKTPVAFCGVRFPTERLHVINTDKLVMNGLFSGVSLKFYNNM